MSDAFWDALHPPSRALQYKHILTDMIAGVRASHRHEVCCDDCPDTYEADTPCPMMQAADRAEARLRQVQGE